MAPSVATVRGKKKGPPLSRSAWVALFFFLPRRRLFLERRSVPKGRSVSMMVGRVRRLSPSQTVDTCDKVGILKNRFHLLLGKYRLTIRVFVRDPHKARMVVKSRSLTFRVNRYPSAADPKALYLSLSLSLSRFPQKDIQSCHGVKDVNKEPSHITNHLRDRLLVAVKSEYSYPSLALLPSGRAATTPCTHLTALRTASVTQDAHGEEGQDQKGRAEDEMVQVVVGALERLLAPLARAPMAESGDRKGRAGLGACSYEVMLLVEQLGLRGEGGFGEVRG